MIRDHPNRTNDVQKNKMTPAPEVRRPINQDKLLMSEKARYSTASVNNESRMGATIGRTPRGTPYTVPNHPFHMASTRKKSHPTRPHAALRDCTNTVDTNQTQKPIVDPLDGSPGIGLRRFSTVFNVGGPLDLKHFNSRQFPIKRKLTLDDYKKRRSSGIPQSEPFQPLSRPSFFPTYEPDLPVFLFHQKKKTPPAPILETDNPPAQELTSVNEASNTSDGDIERPRKLSLHERLRLILGN